MNEKKIFVIAWEHCLKVDIDSPNIDYKEADHVAELAFNVQLQNLQDQPIELKELDYKLTLSIKDNDPLQMNVYFTEDITLTKNDTYPLKVHKNINDSEKIGKDPFMQFLEKNLLSLTFTVKDKEGNKLGECIIP